MSEDPTEPVRPFKWLTNLRYPFDRTDTAFLEKLGEYKVGAPKRAEDRPNALSYDQLKHFNIVGIYTTEKAYRASNPDKITQDMARKALGAEHTALDSHLTEYLDADFHFRPL